jgi:uncharacterized membrane protein (UPF0127 family)
MTNFLNSKKWLATSGLVLLVFICANLSAMSVRANAKMPVVRIAGKNVVKLEVAATDREIERGLMYRQSMPEDCGMVFLFHPPRAVKFWMYHTLISLDMCFVQSGKIVKIFHNVPPCRSENSTDCPTYPEREALLATEVIELNGGYAERHGIKEGDDVVFELPVESK